MKLCCSTVFGNDSAPLTARKDNCALTNNAISNTMLTVRQAKYLKSCKKYKKWWRTKWSVRKLNSTRQGVELDRWILDEVLPNSQMEGKIEAIKKAGWRNRLSGEKKSKWWSNAWEYRRGKTAVGVTASPPNWPPSKLSQKRKNLWKKPEQFHTPVQKRGRWEIWLQCSGPLKSFFQFSKCVVGLGKKTRFVPRSSRES